MAKRYTIKCPECGDLIEMDDYGEVGDVVACDSCNVDLEITKTSPVKLRAVRKSSFDEIDEYEDDSEEESGEGMEGEFEES